MLIATNHRDIRLKEVAQKRLSNCNCMMIEHDGADVLYRNHRYFVVLVLFRKPPLDDKLIVLRREIRGVAEVERVADHGLELTPNGSKNSDFNFDNSNCIMIDAIEILATIFFF